MAETLIAGRDRVRQLAGDASAWVQEMPQYARRVELLTVGDITTIYKAWAEYGSVNSDPAWMILQLLLDTSIELDMTEGIAGGVINVFTFTWDGRAGHSYS
ncbi:MAG: hypothetical protein E2O82_05110 [Betaproteobacteria bacterium]|nr:MAG: hypothetical protein E2O82_05110 [Betaproteobacteria bacterium]